jgi:hypothetical protein
MKSLELLDKIEVEESELIRINEWVGMNQDKYRIAEPILKEGIIIQSEKGEEEDVKIYFKFADDNHIKFEVYSSWSNVKETWVLRFEAYNQIVIRNLLTGENSNEVNNNYWSSSDFQINPNLLDRAINRDVFVSNMHKLHTSCFRTYFNVIAYAQFFKEYVSYSSRKITSTKPKTSNKKNKSNKKVRLTKTYKLNVPDKETLLKKPYQRHIDSWNVVGHWRTYKNGKRVFVRPYTKGDKENTVAKTYKI